MCCQDLTTFIMASTTLDQRPANCLLEHKKPITAQHVEKQSYSPTVQLATQPPNTQHVKSQASPMNEECCCNHHCCKHFNTHTHTRSSSILLHTQRCAVTVAHCLQHPMHARGRHAMECFAAVVTHQLAAGRAQDASCSPSLSELSSLLPRDWGPQHRPADAHTHKCH